MTALGKQASPSARVVCIDQPMVSTICLVAFPSPPTWQSHLGVNRPPGDLTRLSIMIPECVGCAIGSAPMAWASPRTIGKNDDLAARPCRRKRTGLGIAEERRLARVQKSPSDPNAFESIIGSEDEGEGLPGLFYSRADYNIRGL